MTLRRPSPRKLLIASVGVATLNYLPSACSKDSSMTTVANLMRPPLDAGSRQGDNGADAALDARPEAGPPPSTTVANLVLPAPPSQSLPAKKGGS
ncbi:MAG TPA: hypothetical protein VHU80_00845 [Polyangiaceae bacterium]|jgi:hypothetical protein|nr:hypothetical protein [Polyangiaceae bacterium]